MHEGLDLTRVPRHVAIIMDGNGRWANARGLHRTQGHAAGEPALFDVIDGAVEIGVEWLTAYTFSTENWSRDQYEVDFLMHFNVDLLQRRRDELHAKGIRIHFIGERDDPRVPDELRGRMRDAEQLTAANTRMHMVFAFNYGGRTEIARAARLLAEDAAAGKVDPAEIDTQALASRLYLPEMPDPDLVIRTSGELRTSNYLLWEAAYSEYVFTAVLWPDFDRQTLFECIVEYQARNRRFGRAVDSSESATGSSPGPDAEII